MKVNKIKIADVLIEDRQRKDLGDLSELGKSIKEQGLIQPITVRKNDTDVLPSCPYILVAGERRLTASKEQGLTHIQAVVHKGKINHDLIELQENLLRKNMHWTEEICGLVKARNYYKEKAKQKDEEIPTDEHLASVFGVSKTKLSKAIQLDSFFQEQPEAKIREAATINSAYTLMQASASRAMVLELEKMDNLPSILENKENKESEESKSNTIDKPKEIKTSPHKIQQGDYFDFVANYSGERFSLIHTDFPYGVNREKANRGSASLNIEDYSDDTGVFWDYLKALAENQDRLFTSQAHLIIWYPVKETAFLLKELNFLFPKFRLNPIPFIWVKSTGFVADTNRSMKNCYDACYVLSKGDRNISRVIDNWKSHSIEINSRINVTQKPFLIMKHLLSSVVDQYTRVLDPTCGSGTAIQAAQSLGAHSSLGIEYRPKQVESATVALSLRRKAEGL